VKRDPAEKVGVVLTKSGKYDIVEYTDLTEEESKRTVEDGSLFFELGSILMFMLSTKKLLELCQDASVLNKLYNKAFKKIE
jgi:UDP-N-acetylglucosamine pyrophosphorylase